MEKKKICLVFTKNFPFSKMESYIVNELNFLSQSFDKVYFVPYNESSFRENENRLKKFSYLNLSEVNLLNLPNYSLLNRINRAIDIIKILALEIFNSNAKIKTRKKLFSLYFRLKHYHAISRYLSHLCKSEGENSIDFYCYHYWNHDGVVIEHMMKNRFDFQSKKSISRAHSIDLFHNDWPKGFVAFEKLKITHLDIIHTISKMGLTYLKNKFPLEQKKFHLAYLGVPDFFKGNILFPTKKFIILTVSNIAEIKRLHLMPEIMKSLPSEKFQWVHIGDGNPEFSLPLKNLALRSGIDFKFLGHLQSDEIHKFYNEHDILCFLNLSYMEGVPVSIMESMMHGIPSIATNVGGTSELIQNKKNGCLIDIEFIPSEVAHMIETFSADSENWKAMSTNCRETYLQNFNSINNYKKFYSNLIDGI
jgi:colanic acid/amylovoran biosynthesis glycosyltransferase